MTDVMHKITEEMKTGWNACRRQVYLLAEQIQDRNPIGDVYTDFERGEQYTAKSFAKAFNAFEADDCDFLNDAAMLAAPPVPVNSYEEMRAALGACEPIIKELIGWVEGALQCKSWEWSPDQYDYASDAVERANALLAAPLSTPVNPGILTVLKNLIIACEANGLRNLPFVQDARAALDGAQS